MKKIVNKDNILMLITVVGLIVLFFVGGIMTRGI